MKKKSIGKNALLNIIRQSSSMFFSLLLMPYVTRVLGSENYGRYNYCASIVSYFSLISALGIGAYAIRELSALRTDNNKLNKLGSELFTLNIYTTLIAYFLLFITILIWNPNYEYKYLTIVISCEIVFQTISRDWIYNVFEDFFYITFRTVLFQLLRLVAVLIFVKQKEDLWKYAIISCLCSATVGFISFIHSSKYIKIQYEKVNLKKHIPPIIVIFSSSLVASIYMNSDLTMLGIMQGDDAVGIYKVATQVYGIIKAMLNAMVVVMIPRMAYYANNNNDQELKMIVEKALRFLALLLFPTLFGLFMVSKEVVYIIAGEEYISAVEPLRILSFALMFATVGNILLSGILVSIHKEKKSLLITTFSAMTNVVLNLFMIPLASYVGTAYTTLLSEFIVAMLGVYNCRQYLSFKKVKRDIIIALTESLIVIIVCNFIQSFQLGIIINLLLKIIISVFLYVLLLVCLYKDDIIILFKNNDKN